MFGGNAKFALVAAMIPMVGDLLSGGASQTKAGKGGTGKDLANALLTSTGFLDAKGDATGSVFSQAPEARPRTAAELAAGSRKASQVQLSPQSQLVMNNEKLAVRIPDFLQNSTNPQMADFRAKHMPLTVRQGRKTLATPQPKDIKV